jgi:hypothetical protein
MKPTLTLKRLKEVYFYEPETGQFLRLIATNSSAGKAKVGEPAGSKSGERYVRIGIDGRVYRAHRLAWFYMTGEWPENGIDHIDLDATNNRWSNLRAADQSQNLANTKRRSDNTTGFKGVTRTASGTWQAKIWVNQQQICLGTFATPYEAFDAYKSAAEKYFGSFSRTS